MLQPIGKMRQIVIQRFLLAILATMTVGRAFAEDEPSRPSASARLKFLQQILGDAKAESANADDSREFKFQSTPILRYSHAPRNIADSMVFRLGTKGRPIALVTAELYGGTGRQFLLCQEFLAIDDADFQLTCNKFHWTPPKNSGIKFQRLESDQTPAATARLRLAQFRQLAERFDARETWQGVETQLRVLPTPIDRYEPEQKPNSDGAIFAFVQGVNPEALLLLETNGKDWNYAWARLSAAQVTAKLDDKITWEVDVELRRHVPNVAYTCIFGQAVLPASLDTEE